MPRDKKLIYPWDGEVGASMLEYALLAALIAIVGVTAMTFVGQEAGQTFNGVASQVQAVGN